MKLKRDLVKYVRDKAKSRYKKNNNCFICGETENLDFHHFFGLTELLEHWIKENRKENRDRRRYIKVKGRIYRKTRKRTLR